MGRVFARARVGDPPAVGRVVRVVVVGGVVGKSNPILSVDVDRVDLVVVVRVVWACTREGDLLTVGRVRRTEIVRIIVGELDLSRSVGVDGVDLGVVSVVVSVSSRAALVKVLAVMIQPSSTSRVRRLRWQVWGLVYAVPPTLAFLFPDDAAPGNSPFTDILISATVATGLVSVAHAFLIRREYLFRLDMVQRETSNVSVTL